MLDKQYGELSLSVRSIQRLCAKPNEGCDKKIVPIPTLTPAQKRLLNAILNSLRNILLSGVAGASKSYILKMAASYILSIANNAMDKIFTEGVLNMVKNKRNVGFRELGRKKTALFVLNSPMNKSLLSLVDIFLSSGCSSCGGTKRAELHPATFQSHDT